MHVLKKNNRSYAMIHLPVGLISRGIKPLLQASDSGTGMTPTFYSCQYAYRQDNAAVKAIQHESLAPKCPNNMPTR
jgi:hypothetical protein